MSDGAGASAQTGQLLLRQKYDSQWTTIQPWQPSPARNRVHMKMFSVKPIEKIWKGVVQWFKSVECTKSSWFVIHLKHKSYLYLFEVFMAPLMCGVVCCGALYWHNIFQSLLIIFRLTSPSPQHGNIGRLTNDHQHKLRRNSLSRDQYQDDVK